MKSMAAMALMCLPVVLPLGMIMYAIASGCLKRGWRRCCTAALVLLGLGIGYGILRFTGIIRFSGDNSWSVNWLDTTWRDDGFWCVYICGILAAGISAAFHREKQTDS